MNNMSSQKSRDNIRSFIYELPPSVLKTLGLILDFRDDWKILGGKYMNYDCYQLDQFGKSVYRNEYPAETLLISWGEQNHRVSELFCLLAKMKHYRAMEILRPYVRERYHFLIKRTISREDLCSVITKTELNPSSSQPPLKPKNTCSCQSSVKTKQNGDLKPGKNNEKNSKEANERNQNEAAERKSATDFEELGLGLPKINYEDLEKATNGWSKSNVIGRGGFGIVFKGKVKQTPMAIKRLERQKGNEVEFDALEAQRKELFKELKLLNSHRHDNILPLYGYSFKDEKLCLVSQFMPNGSLLDRLQCENNTRPLLAVIRCKIARGIACGLQFLHDRKKPLVHGDMKSANILLDASFEPKIGDFGLSREVPIDNSSYLKVSHVHGTRPYLPDEFLRSKKFSTKVDTYGFGVVLFEIISGLRAFDHYRSEKYLKDYVLKLASENNQPDLIDPKIRCEYLFFEYLPIFLKLFALGQNCVSYKSKDRPTMMDVAQDLDNLYSQLETISKPTIVKLDVQKLTNFFTDRSRISPFFFPTGSTQNGSWRYPSPNFGHPLHMNRAQTPVSANPAVVAGSVLPAELAKSPTENRVARGVPVVAKAGNYAGNDSRPYVNWQPPGVSSNSNRKSVEAEKGTVRSTPEAKSTGQSGADSNKPEPNSNHFVESQMIPLVTMLQNFDGK